ncbi:SpoIIE family protein phosphatase, partial [Kineococcus sp. SYSU DK004]|uniref:SpoIIE family protein phosphatase n=1 Tax=Kineococcus sp. SYSU DK004 TaxID=3383125 RepID=UPI003D7EF703
MSADPPQPVALREEPVAVLLVGRAPDPSPASAPGADAPLLGADAASRALAGAGPRERLTGDLADLAGWLGRARPGAGAAEAELWARAARGEHLVGTALPDGLWLSATPYVDGGVPERTARRTVLALHRAEGAGGAGSSGFADVAGLAVSAVRPGGPDGATEVVVVHAGEGWSRATGTPAHEVVGGPAAALLRTDDLDGRHLVRTALSRSVHEAEPAAVTVLAGRSDGTSFLHHVRTTPLTDPTGAVCHVVSWHSDVTGRAGAEAQLHRALAAEEESAQRLALLEQLDAVVVVDDVAAGLDRVAHLLVTHVAADAALVLTGDHTGAVRPTEAVVAAAAGPRLGGAAGLVGRRLPRTARTRPPDPHLDVDPHQPVRPAPLAGGAPTGPDERAATPSGWIAAQLAGLPALAGGAAEAVLTPLVGRETVVGLLVTLPRPGGGAGRDGKDLAVLAGAARRAGLLVETARLHQREHTLAETLQRSMLPEQAVVPGLDVWTFYDSNAEHAQVGGDWYDVLQTTDDLAAVVVGDVVGHDVEAAAAMGQIRSVVRSCAHDLDDPGSVLGRVDALVGGMSVPRMASLVYASLQRLDDGGWEVSWSSAGHLPPLLRRAGRPGRERGEVVSEPTRTLLGEPEPP